MQSEKIDKNSWERKKQNVDQIFIFHLQERLARIEQEVVEEDQKQRQEAEVKKAQIESAERKRRDGPVDDSQMVDEMFGFIDTQTDLSGDSAGLSAFKVSLWFVLLNSVM